VGKIKKDAARKSGRADGFSVPEEYRCVACGASLVVRASSVLPWVKEIPICACNMDTLTLSQEETNEVENKLNEVEEMLWDARILAQACEMFLSDHANVEPHFATVDVVVTDLYESPQFGLLEKVRKFLITAGVHDAKMLLPRGK